MEVCDEDAVERLFGKSFRNKQSHVARSDSRTSVVIESFTMPPQFSEEDIAEEQAHFSNVVAMFQQYAQYSVGTTSVIVTMEH